MKPFAKRVFLSVLMGSETTGERRRGQQQEKVIQELLNEEDHERRAKKQIPLGGADAFYRRRHCMPGFFYLVPLIGRVPLGLIISEENSEQFLSSLRRRRRRLRCAFLRS
jgi:hypothetical protein